MLREIRIAKQATYSDAGESLAGLKAINFIFGANGSGKTTISRVIAAPVSYPDSNLAWVNGRTVDCLVYNCDFATENFKTQMAGIFTLGQETAGTLAAIEAAREQITKLDDFISDRRLFLEGVDGTGGKRDELVTLRNALEAACWEAKGRHDTHFQPAFEGFRGKKASFCDKVLLELSQNVADIHDIEELKKRALTVFERGLEKIEKIPTIAFDDLTGIAKSEILTKKVVGKEDVDIAGLIRRLGNSDWVKQGVGYIEGVGSPCPFCQRDLPEALVRELNDYFDQTYLTDIANIDALKSRHEMLSAGAIERLEAVAAGENRYLDTPALSGKIDLFAKLLDLNQQHIGRKRKEASAVVTLEPLDEIVTDIAAIIKTANDAIVRHNETVANLASEKKTLTAQIWRCILEEEKKQLADHAVKKDGLDKAVAALSKLIEEKRAELAELRKNLRQLEKSITSVQPTVDDINRILASFGFTSFRLAVAGERQNLYEIVRSDGSDASPTLSEGEKSFITFLYFYHLLRGSISETGTTGDRVIVFDDPVSSLDADVLFIVGALIKRILEEARRGDGPIKQVFVLTHNIYFHKEVSFDPRRSGECRADETFWIVQKRQNVSTIKGFDHNPIRTSYELLWGEVRNPDRSSLTIQNTLRRIIENYFKILGNIDKDAIVDLFEGRDQQICGSLFSWVNDGSHSAHDDLYISADSATVDRYLEVFHAIFEKTQHGAHYLMMMGEAAASAPQTGPPPVPA